MEQKTKDQEDLKQRKREARDQAVMRSRQMQISMRQRKLDEQRVEEDEYKQQWLLQNEAMIEEEKAEKERLKRLNAEHEKFLLKQAVCWTLFFCGSMWSDSTIE